MSDQPFRVAYGMGVDSTAMLIGLHRRGIRPDLILFADTGGELPTTYAYEPVIQRWLAAVGFPPLVTVKKRSPRTGDKSLLAECLRKGLLPSIAYGRKACSLKWKVSPQEIYCNHWPPAIRAWKQGQKVLTALGYDAGPGDGRRHCKAFSLQQQKPDAKYDYWYPLIEWGWDRDECVRVIESEGLPVPPKSSCFFCAAMKKPEINRLLTDHPTLFIEALDLEREAMPKLRTVKGLGRRFSWASYLDELDAARLRREAALHE